MQTSWNYNLLFPTDTDEEHDKELKRVEKSCNSFAKKWKANKDYLYDPAILKKALDEYEILQKECGTSGKTGYYFWLKTHQNQEDEKSKAKYQQITDLSTKLQNELRFFELELAHVEKPTQKLFLSESILSSYHYFLKRIFDKAKHTLSEKEENILSLVSNSSYTAWEKMVSTFLSKEEREIEIDGKKEKKNFSELLSLLSDENKQTRDNASIAFNEILTLHAPVAEAEINAIFHFKKIDDELRGYTRPDESRFIEDDIDTKSVDILCEVVTNHNKIAQDFYALKAKLLGVEKLKYHERNVEYGEIKTEYPFTDAVTLVEKVFSQLDQEFLDILKRFLTEGHIDVYPKKGKRSGAFCVYWAPTHPTYVLLNHNNTLQDVTTLAHEMGHGINNELVKQKQHALYFGTPTSTAEVASTFLEDFVIEELLKSATDEEKLSLLMMKLNQDVSAIFRQIACFCFEQELHKTYREKGYLSMSEIGEIFQKHMKSYMGPGVEQSSGSENWWVYWNHIRMFFYVYSYAGGLLISKAMQAGVRKDPKFILKVKRFLSSGLSESPKDIFKHMGIDITKKEFWEEGIGEIERLLEETKTLAKKLGKL